MKTDLPDVVYGEDELPEQLELPFSEEGRYDCRTYKPFPPVESPDNTVGRANETPAGFAQGISSRVRLLMLHDDLCSQAYDLMQAKNHDYANNADAFRNFRRHGALGIIVRLGDKIARLESFLENGTLAVGSESVRDTVLDVINYAVLLEGYLLDNAKNA